MSIFDEPDLSDEFRDFMLQRSEGNPFVLEELLRDAIDRGDIFRTDSGWDRKALHEIRMPRTVRDTILVRLGSLQPRGRRGAVGGIRDRARPSTWPPWRR